MEQESKYKGSLAFAEVPTPTEQDLLIQVLAEDWSSDPGWPLAENPEGRTDLELITPCDIGIEWLDYRNVRAMGPVLRFVIRKMIGNGWRTFGLYGYLIQTTPNNERHIIVVENQEVAVCRMDNPKDHSQPGELARIGQMVWAVERTVNDLADHVGGLILRNDRK